MAAVNFTYRLHRVRLLQAGILLIWILSLHGCIERVALADLQRFVATETYPEEVFLDTVSNKRALIIVAHDDDDCAMSGTIAKLTAQGWTIRQLSLQDHVLSETGKNPAGIICQGNELILADKYYRQGLDTMQLPYYPISYEEIQEQFLVEKVADTLVRKVNDFRPSVIFTLDDQKGGYGHPDHVFISRLVRELFDESRIGADRIYQSVFTDHMEHEIVEVWLADRLKKWGYSNTSIIADEVYGVNGMPEPTTQVDISSVAGTKMSYLMAYEEDVRSNLRKFIPYYEQFDAESYFGLFNMEYFRVIEKGQ